LGWAGKGGGLWGWGAVRAPVQRRVGLLGGVPAGEPQARAALHMSLEARVGIHIVLLLKHRHIPVLRERHITSARKLAHKTVHTRQIILGVQAFYNHTARARNVPTRTTPTLVRSR